MSEDGEVLGRETIPPARASLERWFAGLEPVDRPVRLRCAAARLALEDAGLVERSGLPSPGPSPGLVLGSYGGHGSSWTVEG